jgi:hypothetical protein
MDVLEILETIKKDWPLLVFVFAVGGIWWQGKEWFKKIETSLTREGTEHHDQSAMLQSIHDKIESLEDRTTKVEQIVTRIHEEQHEQEVKLAVLESTSTRSTATRRRNASRT